MKILNFSRSNLVILLILSIFIHLILYFNSCVNNPSINLNSLPSSSTHDSTVTTVIPTPTPTPSIPSTPTNCLPPTPIPNPTHECENQDKAFTIPNCIGLCKNVPNNMGLHNRVILRLTSTVPPFFLRFYPFAEQDEMRWPIYSDSGLYYENILTDFVGLLSETTPGKLVVDLGANIGWASLLALASGARVVSVEASPATFCILQSAICINGFKDRSTLLNVAIADVESRNVTVPFFVHPNPGASRVCYDDNDKTCLAKAHHVPARNIFQILEDAHVDPKEEIYMMKMDVERIEHLILPTLVPLFRDRRIYLFYFEFCNTVNYPILHEIISYGYDFYVIKEGNQPDVNIGKMFNSGQFGPYNAKTFTRSVFNNIHKRINNAILRRNNNLSN